MDFKLGTGLREAMKNKKTANERREQFQRRNERHHTNTIRKKSISRAS